MALEEGAELGRDRHRLELFHVDRHVRDRRRRAKLLAFENPKTKCDAAVAQLGHVDIHVKDIPVAHRVLEIRFDVHDRKPNLELADQIGIGHANMLHKGFFGALEIIEKVRVIEYPCVVDFAKTHFPSRLVSHRVGFYLTQKKDAITRVTFAPRSCAAIAPKKQRPTRA